MKEYKKKGLCWCDKGYSKCALCFPDKKEKRNHKKRVRKKSKDEIKKSVDIYKSLKPEKGDIIIIGTPKSVLENN